MFSKISKLHISERLCKLPVSDDLQYGFGTGKGCKNQYLLNGKFIAVINSADRVNHYGPFCKLIEKIGVPVCLLHVIAFLHLN